MLSYFSVLTLGKKLSGAKDAEARNILINQDAKYGFREVLDPHTGKVIPKTQFGGES